MKIDLKPYFAKFKDNYPKIIMVIILLAAVYHLYFLYQNFYLTLISPEPVDLTQYQQSPLDKSTEKLYNLIEEKTAIPETDTDYSQTNNPFQ